MRKRGARTGKNIRGPEKLKGGKKGGTPPMKGRKVTKRGPARVTNKFGGREKQGATGERYDRVEEVGGSASSSSGNITKDRGKGRSMKQGRSGEVRMWWSGNITT